MCVCVCVRERERDRQTDRLFVSVCASSFLSPPPPPPPRVDDEFDAQNENLKFSPERLPPSLPPPPPPLPHPHPPAHLRPVINYGLPVDDSVFAATPVEMRFTDSNPVADWQSINRVYAGLVRAGLKLDESFPRVCSLGIWRDCPPDCCTHL